MTAEAVREKELSGLELLISVSKHPCAPTLVGDRATMCLVQALAWSEGSEGLCPIVAGNAPSAAEELEARLVGAYVMSALAYLRMGDSANARAYYERATTVLSLVDGRRFRQTMAAELEDLRAKLAL